MARKEDSGRDRQAQAILEQLTTKTVGPPLASTGLVGDQLPDTVVSVSDFDTVRNQITLELSNVEALNLLNTLGQITNTQSQSGPIPGTGAVSLVVDTTGSGSPVSTLLSPGPGESYMVSGAEWVTKNSNAMYLRIYDGDGSTYTLIEYKTGAGLMDLTTSPLIITYPQTLRAMYGTASGDNTVSIAYCRVR